MKKFLVSGIFASCLVLGNPALADPATSDLRPLNRWIAEQKNIRSVSADFTQTRTLRTLRNPLASHGRLWFIQPDWFRWELGDPPKIIVIGTPKDFTMIQPDKKRAERIQRTALGKFPEFAMLEMMLFPGRGNFEEFQRQMKILSFQSSGSRSHVEMLPRDPQIARGLISIKWDFDAATRHWLSFEIMTQEGSSIRNTFDRVQIDPKLSPQLFQYDLTGFQVIDEKN